MSYLVCYQRLGESRPH